LLVGAVSPTAGALLLEHGGAGATLSTLVMLAVLNVGVACVIATVYFGRADRRS
jgi:hypothetical protein